MPHSIAPIPEGIGPQNAVPLDGWHRCSKPIVPWAHASIRPVPLAAATPPATPAKSVFGPAPGATTSPHTSWRSVSSRPVDTYRIRNTRARFGYPSVSV